MKKKKLKIENKEFEVKKFSNGGHVIVPKAWIGKKIVVMVEEK